MIKRQTRGALWLACMALVALVVLAACSDDYRYDDEDPDFLGGSVYEYLQRQGCFNNYLRLVDDLDYGRVLSLTGSKTVFPADDEAFAAFFRENAYGVHSYEQLTMAQKRSLLFSSMINMSYMADMLANTTPTESTTGEGVGLRRATQYTYLDSISHVTDTVQLSAPFWTRFKAGGIYLVDDDASPYLVHFTPRHFTTNNLSQHEMEIITGGEYDPQAVYINGLKVKKADVVCKNGYVHIMDNVLTPSRNMSQIIALNGQTGIFNSLMNRFSAPYYVPSVDQAVHELYNGSDIGHPAITDTVFVKRYFTEARPYDPDGNNMTNYGLLYLDPSQNSYQGNTDMGAMFVPTDEAMDDYMNSSRGRYLKDAYGSWDNVPTSLVALFVKNHQKKSFMTSLPDAWPTMNDENSFAMHVSEGDIVKTYIGGNGVVYVTNKVYPPIDYQSVYASVMTNDNTKIMNWALQDNTMKFYLYLRSMENMYNLLVPTDEALQQYRDPVGWAIGKSSRRIWSFKFDATQANPVTADVYTVNDDGTRGSYERTITDAGILRNRLYDICDSHIVVGGMDAEGNMSGYIDDGTCQYALTKGGATIKVAGRGESLAVTGGGDIENGVPPAVLVSRQGQAGKAVYDSDNGRTFFIDRVAQSPTKSVFTILGEHAEYSKFFELLNGNDMVFSYFQNDAEITSVFTLNRTSGSSGLGNVVRSFSNFRYTVFVPTNDAVDAAFKADTNLHTWDEIASQDDDATKRAWAKHLTRFLKYHFMDNSVYIDGTPFTGMSYETAARDDNERFQKLNVSSDGSNLTIRDAKGNVAHVAKTAGLYNVQGRDFIVNAANYRRADEIVSSSYSVIHLIDRALMPE